MISLQKYKIMTGIKNSIIGISSIAHQGKKKQPQITKIHNFCNISIILLCIFEYINHFDYFCTD